MKDIFEEGYDLPQEQTIENAGTIVRLRNDYYALHKKVKNGRTALWCLVIYFVLGSLYEIYQYGLDPIIFVANGLVLFIFISCAILAIKKPYLGFLLATIFFLLFVLLTLAIDPFNVIKGILIKGVITYYIIVGLTATKKYITTLKELKYYGITKEGSELI